MIKKTRGTVQCFDVNRGYGFVVNSIGAVVLIGHREMTTNLRNTLKEGDEVTFLEEKTENGYKAIEVCAAN